MELFKLRSDIYDIYIDHAKVYDHVVSPFVMGFNGKFGGKGFLLNPMGLINDGYLDLLLIAKDFTIKSFPGLMDGALKRGGIHAYEATTKMHRAKHIRIVNRNAAKKGGKGKDIKCFNIDGENLFYREFIQYEI